jgi:hypothetical protein
MGENQDTVRFQFAESSTPVLDKKIRQLPQALSPIHKSKSSIDLSPASSDRLQNFSVSLNSIDSLGGQLPFWWDNSSVKTIQSVDKTLTSCDNLMNFSGEANSFQPVHTDKAHTTSSN